MKISNILLMFATLLCVSVGLIWQYGDTVYTVSLSPLVMKHLPLNRAALAAVLARKSSVSTPSASKSPVDTPSARTRSDETSSANHSSENNSSASNVAVDVSSLKGITNTDNGKSAKNVTSSKYLIYRCSGVCGGWSDRLSGIVVSYLLSLVTNRTFGIHITRPACNLTEYLEPNLVNWNLDINSLKHLPSGKINYMDNRNVYLTADNINFTTLINKPVVYYTGNYQLFPRLQKSKFHGSDFIWMHKWTRDRVFAHVITLLFKLTKKLNTKLINFIKKTKPSKEWKLMCAHIRMGKNPSIPNDSVTRNTNETIKVIWDFITKNYTCDKCKIFVATDSEDVRKQAKRLFPDKIVDMPGDIVHIERGSLAKSCNAFAKVILDQHVLSKCDSLILTKSGLGKSAAYLRGTEENLYCLSKKNIVKCTPHNVTDVLGLSG